MYCAQLKWARTGLMTIKYYRKLLLKNEQLVLITAFNIEARYPDLKRSFRK